MAQPDGSTTITTPLPPVSDPSPPTPAQMAAAATHARAASRTLRKFAGQLRVLMNVEGDYFVEPVSGHREGSTLPSLLWDTIDRLNSTLRELGVVLWGGAPMPPDRVFDWYDHGMLRAPVGTWDLMNDIVKSGKAIYTRYQEYVRARDVSGVSHRCVAIPLTAEPWALNTATYLESLFSGNDAPYPKDLITKVAAALIAERDEKTIGRWILAGDLPCYPPDGKVSEKELRASLHQLWKRMPRQKQPPKKSGTRHGLSTDIGPTSRTQ